MKKLYELLFSDKENKSNLIYNCFMITLIVLSVIPLAFKDDTVLFDVLEKITTAFFICDYVLRWITAKEKYNSGIWSYIRYPFSFLAIIDLLSILPSFSIVASSFRVFKVFRLVKSLKVFKALKIFRYSKNIEMMVNIAKKQKNALLTVIAFAGGYILVSALVIYSVEPTTFRTFFEAIYWATISLTTVGYGDIYPVTTAGRIVTMISSLVGVAIVALPASILTAGYMEELHDK
mgnify:CR=1 FL=1